jgi:muramoyltetrapeptide carboxypeptidase
LTLYAVPGALAAARKRWLGHSDFTAFQLAALAHAGMTTFAGPMAAYDFGAETPSAYTLDHCWGLLGHERYEVECALEGPDYAGEGTLWGGNLAMVAHLTGTPHLPRVDGGILFLEDTGEHPYRAERMLYQLHFAGVLSRQRAVLLGTFNGYDLTPNDNGYDAAAMVAQVRTRFRCLSTPGSRSVTAPRSSPCRWVGVARSRCATAGATVFSGYEG